MDHISRLAGIVVGRAEARAELRAAAGSQLLRLLRRAVMPGRRMCLSARAGGARGAGRRSVACEEELTDESERSGGADGSDEADGGRGSGGGAATSWAAAALTVLLDALSPEASVGGEEAFRL